MDPSQAIISSTLTVASSGRGTGDDPSSGTRLGDFTLLKRLGKGAQGEVYEARQESLGRLVALKVLPPYLTFSPERVQRFRREAEAGGRLDHPCTVGVHAVGEVGGYHYIAQELVAGGLTLADRIAQARREPDLEHGWHERTAGLLLQIAEAVHAAHEAGIVHRDIKPGNILITKDGQPKVADFGLAMVVDDVHRSHTGELIGTPFYMSPEQAAGGRAGLDRRTDVFSLGATMYEALTLQRPFEGESREGIIERILLHDPPEPRKVRPSIPRDLSLICMQALEKRRERRYQSAAEFAEELRRFLRHEPILARPPGLAARAGKWVHRHTVLSAAGSVALVAMVAVTGLLVDNAAAWKSSAHNEGLAAKEQSEHRRAVELLLQAMLDTTDLGRSEPSPSPPASDPFRLILQRAAASAATIGEIPALQWQIQFFTGVQYRNLSIFDEGERLLSASLATAQASLASDPEFADRIALSQLELGRLRHWTGRWEEAESLVSAALAAFVQLHGAASAQAANAGVSLARIEYDAGRPGEAETTIRRAIDALSANRKNAPELLWARQFLGTLLLDTGRADEAAPHLLEVHDLARGVYPDTEWVHLGFVVAHLHDVRGRAAAAAGDAATAAAEDAEAESLFRDDLARMRSLDSRPRIDVANASINFGSFLRERGRPGEARPVLEDALATAQLATGADSRSSLAARNSLALCLYDLGDPAAAEALWRESVEADHRAPQRDARPALSALKSLATLYRHQKRLDEALAAAQELVARTPPDDPTYAGRAQLLSEIEKARTEPPKPGAP